MHVLSYSESVLRARAASDRMLAMEFGEVVTFPEPLTVQEIRLVQSYIDESRSKFSWRIDLEKLPWWNIWTEPLAITATRIQ